MGIAYQIASIGVAGAFGLLYCAARTYHAARYLSQST